MAATVSVVYFKPASAERYKQRSALPDKRFFSAEKLAFGLVGGYKIAIFYIGRNTDISGRGIEYNVKSLFL